MIKFLNPCLLTQATDPAESDKTSHFLDVVRVKQDRQFGTEPRAFVSAYPN